MESRSATAITTVAKIRSGKKWKKRDCVLERSSPSIAEVASLTVYKDVKCGLKSTRKKRVVRLEGFYGLESGFRLDKESHTLAVICHSCVAVIAFEEDYMLHSWELWLRDFFGQSLQYRLLPVVLPAKFSHLKNSQLRLHLRNNRFCMVHEWPANIVVELGLRDLHRFNVTDDGKFCFQCSAGVREYAGIYTFQVEGYHPDYLSWTFNMAQNGRLNDCFPERKDADNVSMIAACGSIRRSLVTPSSKCYGERSTRYVSPVKMTTNDPPVTRSRFERTVLCTDSSSPKGMVSSEDSSSVATGRMPLFVSRAPTDSSELSRGHHRVKRVGMPSSSTKVRQRSYTRPPANRQIGNENADAGTTFALISKTGARPKSTRKDGCSIPQNLHGKRPTGRPLSEVLPSLAHCGSSRTALLSIPVPPSACSRCRNYVNQPFIESLQYYYNIDHVVLALSKKSKCCDHVCTGDKREEDSVANGNGTTPAAAPARPPVSTEESVVVNVPSKDYAAMAPRGGLYVLMEPIRVDSPSKTPSEMAVPDDPLHVDETDVVTVPSTEVSKVATAQSGIVVKPFEPLILLDRRSMVEQSAQNRRVRRHAMGDVADWRNRSAPPVFSPGSNFSGVRHSLCVPTQSIGDQHGKCDTTNSTLESASSSIWRSASFVAKDAIRSSTRRTKAFFGDLARRASSTMTHREQGSRIEDTDGRQSRARSEPPDELETQSDWRWLDTAPCSVESEIFKFPPSPAAMLVNDDSDEPVLLNYATLAQDVLTPLSAGASSRSSARRSVTSSSPAPTRCVEYAKIDHVATQAARMAVIACRDEFRTLSDGEHSIDTSISTVVSRRPSSVKRNRPFQLKKQLGQLGRRVSVTSLSSGI